MQGSGHIFMEIRENRVLNAKTADAKSRESRSICSRWPAVILTYPSLCGCVEIGLAGPAIEHTAMAREFRQ